MKTLALIPIALAVIGLVTTIAPAEGDADRGESRREVRGARGEGAIRVRIRAEAADGRTRVRTERVETDGEHHRRMHQAVEDHREKLQQWQERNRDLARLHRESVEKLGRDHDATKAIATELREHLQARRELHQKMVEGMRRQAETRRAPERARAEVRRPAERPCAAPHAMRRLDLTERQQRQIRRIMENARRRIVEDVLTDQQREQLEQAGPERPTRDREDRPDRRRDMRRDRRQEREPEADGDRGSRRPERRQRR